MTTTNTAPFIVDFSRFGAPVSHEFQTLVAAIEAAVGAVDENTARPLVIRHDAVILWEDQPDASIFDFAAKHGVDTRL